LAERAQVTQAFPLFARAARAGIAEAEYRVGRCYLEGSGVPVSRVEALLWLKRAAVQGHAEAQSLLAVLYLQGFGPSDMRKTSGERAAASLFSHDEPHGPDFAAAEEWARRAADAGSPEGQAVLAYVLTFGPAPLRDLEAAHRLYERSAEGGCPQGALGYALSLSRRVRDEEGRREVAKQERTRIPARDTTLPAPDPERNASQQVSGVTSALACLLDVRAQGPV